MKEAVIWFAVIVGVLTLALVAGLLIPSTPPQVYKNKAGQYVEPYTPDWLEKHKDDRRIVTLGNGQVVSVDY